MPWIILLVSGVFEAVWATALGMSDSFRNPGPTLVFAVACFGSMWGLAHAMKSIPTGTAYAVWTGVGAGLTVAYAMATGNEDASPLKVLFLVGLIGAVVGLKVVGGEPAEAPGRPDSSDERR